jgi:RecA-family ATPase
MNPIQPSTLDPAEPSVRMFRVRTFAELGDVAPPAREWLVEGLIPMGTVTFISGDGGLGKTLLGQQLIMAAALGAVWCGRPTRQMPAVALFCEDEAEEIHRRAVPIAEHFGIAVSDPRLKACGFLCELGEDNAMMRPATNESGPAFETTRMYDTIKDWARRRQARLIVLDSLHDVFTGNENYRPEARAFVQVLTSLARAINGAVVVLAHPSLTGLDRGSGTSGSTAWNNAVRSRLYLTQPDSAEDDETRILRTVKANYGKTGETIVLRRRKNVFVAEQGGESTLKKVARRPRQQFEPYKPKRS